jgi:hypothetical protein
VDPLENLYPLGNKSAGILNKCPIIKPPIPSIVSDILTGIIPLFLVVESVMP